VHGGTGNPTLGCRDVQSPADPIGNLDAVTSDDSVRVTGWAIDPDRAGPINVHLYIDGRWAGQGTANTNRPDVGLAYPAFGSDHGFDFTVPPVSDGRHRACAYGINVGPGANKLLGCRDFTVAHNPFGSLDSLTRTAGGASIGGWAIDPDEPTSPTSIHVYVDGAWGGSYVADVLRPDVALAYPAAGPAHGFQMTVPVGAGARRVCVYAINLGPGTASPLLGCRTV
jgi:hypothetical protein